MVVTSGFHGCSLIESKSGAADRSVSSVCCGLHVRPARVAADGALQEWRRQREEQDREYERALANDQANGLVGCA
jgi:hypothetical protein